MTEQAEDSEMYIHQEVILVNMVVSIFVVVLI